jgi:broad specificity phosphatase PhoE
MSRLLLVRHASTPATRRAAFPLDEPLDPPGVLHARALRRFLARADRTLIGPALSARQTAAEAGLEGEIDAALAGWDDGTWAGLTLEDVERQDPEGVTSWRVDPQARPHGGESLADLVERARAFVDRIATVPGRTAAVTDGGFIKAAIVAALDAPVMLFWSIDVSPASITELAIADERATDGSPRRWRLIRSNWTPPVPDRATQTSPARSPRGQDQ